MSAGLISGLSCAAGKEHQVGLVMFGFLNFKRFIADSASNSSSSSMEIGPQIIPHLKKMMATTTSTIF